MDIEYVAGLAKLELTEEEKKKFASQLGDVLGYVEKLNGLDTSGVNPVAHIAPIKNVTREDNVCPSTPRELIEKMMPQGQDGFYKVPPTIE